MTREEVEQFWKEENWVTWEGERVNYSVVGGAEPVWAIRVDRTRESNPPYKGTHAFLWHETAGEIRSAGDRRGVECITACAEEEFLPI